MHINKKGHKPEVYSEPSPTFKKERFVKIVNGFYALTIFAESFILNVQQCSEEVFVNNLKTDHCFFPEEQHQPPATHYSLRANLVSPSTHHSNSESSQDIAKLYITQKFVGSSNTRIACNSFHQSRVQFLQNIYAMRS